MSNILPTTGNTSVVCPITDFSTIRLRKETPLCSLNDLFPSGVPVFSPEPTLSINGWDCYEVIHHGVNTCDLTIALFQPNSPINLCRVFLEWGIVAIPSEWVEGGH